MPTDLAFKSATSLISGFKTKRFTPLDALEAVLERIAKFEPTLNAFQLVDEKTARTCARASTKRWAAGDPVGLLDGVPVAIKDVTETKGWPTLNGSLAIDRGGPWQTDAVVVERFRAHGAVLIGKTQTPEFAWRGVTESKLHGITRNPWNPAWTPCGSSGGSGAAVAAGMSTIATGTDSGGSIRGPASFCNIVGFKPTFGRVPVWPVSPMLSVEHCGPLTRTVKDAALAFSVMAGFDPRDGFALHEPAPRVLSSLNRGVSRLNIAFSPDLGFSPIDAEVSRGVRDAQKTFADLGAKVTKIKLDLNASIDAAGYIYDTLAARLLQNLGKHRKRVADALLLEAAARGERLSASDHLNAEVLRNALRAKMARLHVEFDLLITPSVSVPPFSAKSNHMNNLDAALRAGSPWMRTLMPFDLTGQPALSVPCGITSQGGPFGLQIVGAFGNDALVLRAAHAFEKAQPVGRSRPPELA